MTGRLAAGIEAALTDLPEAETQRAAEALATLRWHPALRRRAPEVHAEAVVRAAAASAAVDGARVDPDLLRLAATDGPVDPAAGLAQGALRAALVLHRAGDLVLRTPAQVLARAHATAAVGTVPTHLLGRPRPGTGDGPVAAVVAALTCLPRPPGVVLAPLVHAELVVEDVFPPVSGVIGRALARAVATATGLDPLGIGVPEVVCAGDPDGYRAALDAYATGGAAGAVDLVRWWAEALVVGAGHGGAAADTVLAGRLP